MKAGVTPLSSDAYPVAAVEGEFHCQLMSDVHLEFLSGKDPSEWDAILDWPVTAPFLLLAGDIGYPAHPSMEWLLKRVSARYQAVIIVAGNHEYYKTTIEMAEQRLKTLCAELPNVHFLQKESVRIHGFTVLGCTLWPSIPPWAARVLGFCVNDYRQITWGPELKLLTVGVTNQWNEEHGQWLRDQVEAAKASGDKVIIVTHHAPTARNTLWEESREEAEMRQMEFCDLEDMMCPEIRMWAYGHTHWSSSQVINGTQVISNQQGYLTPKHDWKSTDTAYDASLVFSCALEDADNALHVAAIANGDRGIYEGQWTAEEPAKPWLEVDESAALAWQRKEEDRLQASGRAEAGDESMCHLG